MEFCHMVPGSRPDSIIGVDKSRKTIMTNKQIFPWLIFAVLVVMMALKLLADFQPLPGIWWTHKQAMDFGGFAIIALVIWFLMLGRD
jgi:hypothetical protein